MDGKENCSNFSVPDFRCNQVEPETILVFKLLVLNNHDFGLGFSLKKIRFLSNVANFRYLTLDYVSLDLPMHIFLTLHSDKSSYGRQLKLFDKLSCIQNSLSCSWLNLK